MRNALQGYLGALSATILSKTRPVLSSTENLSARTVWKTIIESGLRIMSNEITISAERFAQLVIAERDANALKAFLMSRKYLGLTGAEVAMVCNTMGLTEEE